MEGTLVLANCKDIRLWKTRAVERPAGPRPQGACSACAGDYEDPDMTAPDPGADEPPKRDRIEPEAPAPGSQAQSGDEGTTSWQLTNG